MRKAVYLALGVFLFWVGNANAQTVLYNFDRDADFSKYKTYKWVSIKNADLGNATTQKQIEEALDAELKKKGLIKTESSTADLDIGYQRADLRRLITEHTKKMTTGRAGVTDGKVVWSPLSLPSRNIRSTSGS